MRKYTNRKKQQLRGDPVIVPNLEPRITRLYGNRAVNILNRIRRSAHKGGVPLSRLVRANRYNRWLVQDMIKVGAVRVGKAA